MTKIALKDKNTGLFPNEELFARALSRGLDQSEAYRASHSRERVTRLSKEAINVRASKMASNPRLKERVRALLDEAKISDLDNIGRAFTDLMRFIFKAEEKSNFTALAALMRLRLQVIGALKENVLVNMESTISDDELVKRMTSRQPELAALLRKSLGRDDGYAN